MQIAILLFDRFTVLDAIGPYQMLGRLPDAEAVFVAERPGPISDEEGSLLLSAHAGAGLLAGRRATSHWLALDELGRLGAPPVSKRVVVDGKYVTAAGVSAGIDMGLALAGRIAGDEVAQAIQAMTEYDPAALPRRLS